MVTRAKNITNFKWHVCSQSPCAGFQKNYTSTCLFCPFTKIVKMVLFCVIKWLPELRNRKKKHLQAIISKASSQFQNNFIDMFLITKTRLYKFDPLEPHFYIVKLGFTGVYIIFLISAQNIDCGYLLEPPRRGGSNEYPQSMFWAEIWKISEFFTWIFSVFWGEIFFIFE